MEEEEEVAATVVFGGANTREFRGSGSKERIFEMVSCFTIDGEGGVVKTGWIKVVVLVRGGGGDALAITVVGVVGAMTVSLGETMLLAVFIMRGCG